MIESADSYRSFKVNVLFLRQLLTTSRVGQLGPKEIPVLRGEQTITEAVREMRAHSHGSAMVCRDGRLIGIFTERDLLKLLASGTGLDQPLTTVMTAHPRTVTLDDTLMTVIQLMDEGGYRRLPVVDRSGSPVGVVDVKSVVHFLVEHFPKAVYNQAPHALLNARDREGA
ncbi:MAG TPA: CBS domain-containing protein [Planctomycetaceae bacterium]|nr:CBS domain-containing protein [Planctomycetaceae bacterium]